MGRTSQPRPRHRTGPAGAARRRGAPGGTGGGPLCPGTAAKPAPWAAVSTAVTGAAPLMLGIADDPDPVRVDDSVAYTLRFGNRGSTAQLSTSLTVTLPAGMTATATTGGGVVAGNTVTWDLGTVNAGQNGERRLTVSVDDLAPADPLVRLTRAVLASST